MVCEQFRISAGEPLSLRQEQVQLRGWAVECRIYAEDSEHAMAPSPGVIRRLQEPLGPGVRLDSGIYAGWEVSIHYDPLLSKLITFGTDRTQAIARMKRAIQEYKIAGIKTNLSLFAEILSDPEFLAGNTHIEFLGEMHRRAERAREQPSSTFRSHALAAALAYADVVEDVPQSRPEAGSTWKLSGRPGFSSLLRR